MNNPGNAMMENLKEKTGKTIDEWRQILQATHYAKHGEMVKFLKETHQVTHGYASEIALKILGTDAASASDTAELFEAQYKGKENMKPIYDALILAINGFDGEYEASIKKTYVSLRRKKQFVILNPATKARFEIGFNLKGTEATERLQNEKPNGICSHKLSLSSTSEIDDELIGYLKKAYEQAG